MNELTLKDKDRVEVTNSSVVTISDNSSPIIIIKPEGKAEIRLKIGKNCSVNCFIMQEKNSDLIQLNSIGEHSVINVHGLWLNNGNGKITNSLDGSFAQAYDVHVFAQKGNNKFYLDSRLRHASDNTKGSILVKGVAKDEASAKLDGMIKIEKNGGGASSFLSQHVILLNPGAHATANPELEIENNDVSSRHAASVSQIDEEKIFYLMSRGISRDEARKLIIEGFLESAIETISVDEIKKEFIEKTIASF
ncbi:SufD family Fe-S cluster assembly protein [Candidatus Micrarchaeota archaeon]|nr:SufD family Fe-S cluster assembly protein [Candidatus Micrarchaeota archaeon]